MDGDVVGDEVDGVETHSELADQVDVRALGEGLDEGRRTGLGDRAELVDQIVLGHAAACAREMCVGRRGWEEGEGDGEEGEGGGEEGPAPPARSAVATWALSPVVAWAAAGPVAAGVHRGCGWIALRLGTELRLGTMLRPCAGAAVVHRVAAGATGTGTN